MKTSRGWLAAIGLAAALVVGVASGPPGAAAQTVPPPTAPPPATADPFAREAVANTEGGGVALSLTKVLDAVVALPVATALGAALALRPRRRGTPKRSAPIVQTQIILALIGALVMLVVGSSLARAFGVVGAAGLVRYRARVQDPKDAGVMLSTLAVGLASGVGLYALAAFAAAFIMAVLWVIESFEPQTYKPFLLKVATTDVPGLQPKLETLLRRQRARFELRAASDNDVSYQVGLPVDRGTDAVTKSILADTGATSVDWTEEKKKPSDGTD